MYHRWSLAEIVGAILHGLAQRILDLAPWIDPWSEPSWPPSWFLFWSDYTTWSRHRDSRGIPDTYLIELYLKLAWTTLGYWTEEVGTWARDTAQNWARAVTGYALYSYTTFSGWIDAVGKRLGAGMVSWGLNAVDALWKVWNWLPEAIRTNLQNWSDFLNFWIQKAKDWVVATYHTYITWGTNAWAWVTATGTSLRVWWESARGLLDEFRANPAGFIVARLGTTWSRLMWFSTNLLDWYSNLWSSYRVDLAAFLANPGGWIWDRLDEYVERIW